MSQTPLHVETIGSGPDLVMLHGWAMHGGYFSPVLESLARMARVHVVDLPGHGRSTLWPEGYQLDAIIESVLASVTPRLADNATWLGWSLGGTIATCLAAREDSPVKRLMLVATNPSFIKRTDWHNAMEAEVLGQFASELSQDYEQTLLRFLSLQLRGIENSRALLRLLREQLRRFAAPAPEVLMGGLNILNEQDTRAHLSQLEIPVQLLAGEKDTLVPITAMYALVNENPHFQLQIFTGAGHVPFLSATERFIENIQEGLHELAT